MKRLATAALLWLCLYPAPGAAQQEACNLVDDDCDVRVDEDCVDACPVGCDDGLVETVDACDPYYGCAHSNVVCDDNLACTADAFDPSIGACAFIPLTGTPCPPAGACATDAVCVAGSCVCLETCGNNQVEGAETCDDGDRLDGDGCSATCQVEDVNDLDLDTVPDVADNCPVDANTAQLDLDLDGDGDACDLDDDDDLVTDGLDCAPLDAARYPGAVEVCEGFVDEDCDAEIDEGCVPPGRVCVVFEVTSVSPTPWTVAASRRPEIVLEFSHLLRDDALDAVRLTGRQTGPRTFTGTVEDATVRVTPDAPFLAGERVQVSLDATLADGVGVPLAHGLVYEFTAPAPAGFGELSAASTLNAPNASFAGLWDLDGDGDLDVVAAGNNPPNADLSVFLNQGDGTFDAPGLYGLSQIDVVEASDVDGDGDLDLVAGRNANQATTVLLNDGHGGFVLDRALGNGAWELGVGDLNGDGRGELLVSQPGNASRVYQDARANYAQVGGLVFPQAPGRMAASDLDGDLLPELAVVARAQNGGVDVFRALGGLTFAPRARVTGQQTGTSLALAVADFDGDAVPDLLTTVDNSTPQLHRGLGALAFAPALSIGGPADSALNVQAADFDADDRMDFAFASGGGTFAVWLNEVAGWRRIRPTRGAPGLDLFPEGRCAVGDVDGDEDVDVACANLAGVVVFLNRPDLCPADANSVSPGPCGCALPVVDADLDGVFDPCDNCVDVPNPDQADVDGNTIGDVCEPLDPDAALPELDAEIDAELDAEVDAELDAEALRPDEGRMMLDARIIRRDAAPQDAESVDAESVDAEFVDAQSVDARLERPDQGRPDVRVIDAEPVGDVAIPRIDAAPPADDAAPPADDAAPPADDAAPALDVASPQDGRFLPDATPLLDLGLPDVVRADLSVPDLSVPDLARPDIDAARPIGPDLDGDGVPDTLDLCPYRADPDQADTDGDGVGDLCDFDDGNEQADRDISGLKPRGGGLSCASTPARSGPAGLLPLAALMLLAARRVRRQVSTKSGRAMRGS
ncbi:MAG: FG-GAP-like repeat-containing protein [Bradymonadia bacterium]